MLIDFNASPPRLSIEPLTRTWNLEEVQNGDALQYSVVGKTSDPFKRIEFNGTFQNGSLTGMMDWDGVTDPVTFAPIVAVDSAVLDKYEGVYRFDSGRALSIIVSPSYEEAGLRFFADGLTMTDFSNGDLRALYAFDDTTFAVGALRTTGQPFEGRVQFIVDESGNSTGLLFWDAVDSQDEPQRANRILYTQEDVTYPSADGIMLAGQVSTPESDMPLPGIVMLHGSEAGTRDNFGNKLMAHYMISQGIAILNYDKRGVGESQGLYRESFDSGNLEVLAQDAIAGAEFLAARPTVDAERIGLIGGSQAGWVIPLAASKSDRIAYVIILSGPVISTLQEDVYSSATDDGESQVVFDAEALNQRLRTMKPGGFDPVPIIAGLNQPGLWLWGEADLNQPSVLGAENLQAIIDLGKNKFSYHLFANADHNLNENPSGLFNQIPFAPRVVFYPVLTEWIEKFVLKRN